MNPEREQRLRDETFAAYGTQIDAMKGESEELHFAVDDEKIKTLSERQGYITLGNVREFTVRLVRTAKGVIYVLLLSAFLSEGIGLIKPVEDHKSVILQEYSQIESWESRVNKRG